MSVSEAVDKKYRIRVIMECSTQREDGSRVVDSRDIVDEGAESLDEQIFKQRMIEAAVYGAKDQVRQGMQEMASNGLAEGQSPEQIDWRSMLGFKKVRRKRGD